MTTTSSPSDIAPEAGRHIWLTGLPVELAHFARNLAFELEQLGHELHVKYVTDPLQAGQPTATDPAIPEDGPTGPVTSSAR